jgi:hypothetical protein
MLSRFPDLNGSSGEVDVTHEGEIIIYTSLQSEALKGRDYFKYIWQDNIKMNMKEIEYEVLNLIHLCQEQVQWQSLPKQGTETSGSVKGW